MQNPVDEAVPQYLSGRGPDCPHPFLPSFNSSTRIFMPRTVTLARRVERLDASVAKLLKAQARVIRDQERKGAVSERNELAEDAAFDQFEDELNALRAEGEKL